MSFTAESFADFLREVNDDLANDPLDKEQDEMCAVVRDAVIENYSDEVDYNGIAWEPRKQDYEHDPLRETYRMFAASTVGGNSGANVVKSRDEVVMSIDESVVPYAANQNYGAPEKNLPAREYMFIRQEHQPRLDVPAEEAMNRVLEKSIQKHQSR